MKPIWIAMLNLIIKLIDGQICNNLLLIATKFEFSIWKMASQDTAQSCSSISVNTAARLRKMKVEDKQAH